MPTVKGKRGAALARRLATLPVLLATVLIVAGCPAPIPRTEITSAPVVGTLEWADGAPIAGADIVVSTESEWGKPPCGTAALRTRSDDSGAFALPGTEKHYSTTWFVPGLDIVPPSYLVCASVGGVLRVAYSSYGALGSATHPDSVACVAWELDAKIRLNCGGRAGRDFVTGGQWVDDSTGHEGFYRILLADEPKRPKGSKKKPLFDQPYVYVQWLRPVADGTRHEVVATTGLSIDHNKAWTLSGPQLWRHEGPWVVSLTGYKYGSMGRRVGAEVVFQLGAPGQATLIAGP